MVNKFLYPNGGSETYIFKLGDYLKSIGHEVQYFGMEHEGRCVSNNAEQYTTDMDFHGGSKLRKIAYPFKTIYSAEAKKKISIVLDDFQPDVIHLNNFNYQLTPSIIYAVNDYKKRADSPLQIILIILYNPKFVKVFQRQKMHFVQIRFIPNSHYAKFNKTIEFVIYFSAKKRIFQNTLNFKKFVL